jgi:hypothetical protein
MLSLQSAVCSLILQNTLLFFLTKQDSLAVAKLLRIIYLRNRINF